MLKNFRDYKAKKQNKKRILAILIATMIMATVSVFMRECSQSFDQPYNKGYSPVDQVGQGK